MNFPGIPAIPPVLVAALAGIWAAVLLWQFVGRREMIRSRDAARLNQVLRDAQAEEALKQSTRKGLGDELQQAGLNLTPGAFSIVRIALAAVALVVMTVLGFPGVMAIGVAFASWYLLRYWVQNRIRSRAQTMDKELPMALARIAALLDIEKDMPNLLMAVSDALVATNRKSVLAEELRRTAAELRNRGPKALEDLEARAPSPALATVAFQLRTFLEAGGEQTALMRESADRMQRFLETRNRAMAKASSALLVTKALPLFLGFVSLFQMRDPEIGAFFRSAMGQTLILVIAGVMFLGYNIMKKMVEEVG